VRQPTLRAAFGSDELIIDSFAGGGGASHGIQLALGRSPDIAINHDATAIRMHELNHPETRHFRENIWRVDPREACGSRPIGLAWFSPDCRHFSRAKGGAPVKKEIRGLAWTVTRWARAVKPRVICLENVEAFADWGPVVDGRPCPKRRGKTFRAWLSQLRGCGYEVDYRELVAADYGAPTTRNRLYLVARCDDQPIIWPEATHGAGRPLAWRAAHEVIDWSLPAQSVFERKRPLVEATMKRLANGVHRFVCGAAEPFIVRHGHFSNVTGEGDTFRGQPLTRPLSTICATNDRHLVLPFVAKHYGGPNGQQTPGLDVRQPLSTVTAVDHHALVAAFVTKFYGTSTGSDLRLPMPTVTGQGNHLAEVRALLSRYPAAKATPAQRSLFAVPERELGSVRIGGERYDVTDLLMRMLSPRELFRAQGFPDSYRIDGFTQEAQIRLCGNSVVPAVARAIVAANLLGERAVAA
jgi:DNA (cytosine-5)-methyltransferase 1